MIKYIASMLCISLLFSCTTEVDSPPSQCSGEPSSSSRTFIDRRDSKSYGLVKIGTQTWMSENLNYDVKGSRCYTNLKNHCDTYGRLYDWATAMGLDSTYNSTLYSVETKHTGICPSGWHIPSDAEWGALMKFINPNCTLISDCAFAGMLLKDSIGWNSGNGTNAYGFSALPGGSGGGDGSFSDLGYEGGWWSDSEVNSNSAYYRIANHDKDNIRRYSNSKSSFRSIRCLKD